MSADPSTATDLKALSAKWRRNSGNSNSMKREAALLSCADELDAALSAQGETQGQTDSVSEGGSLNGPSRLGASPEQRIQGAKSDTGETQGWQPIATAPKDECPEPPTVKVVTTVPRSRCFNCGGLQNTALVLCDRCGQIYYFDRDGRMRGRSEVPPPAPPTGETR